MARHDRKCRRCGGWYDPGSYGAHTRGLAHSRQVVADAKARRQRQREADKANAQRWQAAQGA